MSWLREPNAEPIPGYRLIEPLGSGGFGEVWKCEAPGGLFKAIKFVYGNLNSLDVDGVRAEQELHALQRIKEVRHPFVCSLDRIENIDGELVIVMELADRSLHDLYVENQAAGLIGIPRDNLLRYLRDAAEALDHMNEKHKLQHLDVKPRNLFLISDRVKVADFGLVKHLERRSASGLLGGVTPLYAPPETFNGKISERSDQYSLAIVYQELLTGQRPFTGKNVRQLAQQHLKEEPDLRALPEAERPIVARSLAKDPAKRFPNCMAFLYALHKARSTTPREQASTSAGGANGQRPKSMSDTMEDIQLEAAVEGASPSSDEEVDLGGPPSPSLPEEANGAVSEMGITVAQPQTGALRPTLIIGVGGFGRKALLELRCRFLDRFGDLSKIPLLRFLCVDPDPEAVNVAVRGAPEVALTRGEVYHLPLQPVGNYRRRMIDQLSEWLPREKLYALPRSLQTQGSRALGRLAFVDNQQRLLARLKRDIQEITNPDILYQSVTQTGLALRDNTPRVYVIAAAGGGGSGLLADLGYGLRRMLSQLRHPDAELTTMLLCGAPSDPATPKIEQANIYATLTELNHYSDSATSFAAQYGVDGQRIVDQGRPFGSAYLLPLAHRSPEALEAAVSHLGSYLFHELTTPLGLRLDQLRHDDGLDTADQPAGGMMTPFRSFGTFAVWFPRGLLLRLAARTTCRRLIEGWLAPGEAQLTPEAAAEVTAVCDRIIANPDLRPEALCHRIEEASRSTPLSDLGSTPAEALTALLATLGEQAQQSIAQDDPGNWSRQALTRVRDWVGAGGEGNSELGDWRKTKLNRVLTTAAQKVAEDWDQQLAGSVLGLMEHPGARMAAAETALERLQRFCESTSEAQRARLEQQHARTAQAWQQVASSLEACLAGNNGFRLFGGRSRGRHLQGFMESLSHFARQRLAEEVITAGRQFFAALHSRLSERLRDLGFCRQRLRHLQESLDEAPHDPDYEMEATRAGADLGVSHSPLPSAESFWEAIRQSETARVVLPEGENDLERSAVRFLQRLSPEQWVELDQELHERVLLPQGGLHKACVNGGELGRVLTGPLMDEAARILGEHLPIMDVAQILGSEFGVTPEPASLSRPIGASPEVASPIMAYLERATPLLAVKGDARQHPFLLVPASPAGKALAEAVAAALPDVKLVRVPGQSDLMFCREQGELGVEDLQRVLRACHVAYNALVSAPQTSPHARFDVLDWLPLDP
jgi:eukaryotic-like serine/threonine-protein kinase